MQSLFFYNGISILGIHFAYSSCCYVRQTLEQNGMHKISEPVY